MLNYTLAPPTRTFKGQISIDQAPYDSLRATDGSQKKRPRRSHSDSLTPLITLQWKAICEGQTHVAYLEIGLQFQGKVPK